ncbi:hypothetical protein ST47_g6412 [Ascochyta rabiei]|uniref:Uncharacterized protein n=1 Tax=Didymella rabiei TaxID=5454 RepID=A0A163CED1_DIDRA|nr:hypothetical protein ST47_g6412 [Ascochyta rabiei]
MRGNKNKSAAHRRRQSQTPVKDRLTEVVAARRKAGSKSVDTAPAMPPLATIFDAIGNWFIGKNSDDNIADEASPFGSTVDSGASPSHTPLSKKAKKRIQKRHNQSIEIETFTPSKESTSVGLDDAASLRQHPSASHITSSQLINGSMDYSPRTALYERNDAKRPSDTALKRDSVISNNWEDVNLGRSPRTTKKPGPSKQNWRRLIKRPSWCPCRLYLWLGEFLSALARGFQGPRRADFFLSLGLFLVCSYVTYVALDFVLFGLIKGVKAQNVVDAANCSVVYVTIPGPIITISLIAATPSDPARGTYYYSVINGTTGPLVAGFVRIQRLDTIQQFEPRIVGITGT